MCKSAVANTNNSFLRLKTKETFVNYKLVIHYNMNNGTHDINGYYNAKLISP